MGKSWNGWQNANRELSVSFVVCCCCFHPFPLFPTGPIRTPITRWHRGSGVQQQHDNRLRLLASGDGMATLLACLVRGEGVSQVCRAAAAAAVARPEPWRGPGYGQNCFRRVGKSWVVTSGRRTGGENLLPHVHNDDDDDDEQHKQQPWVFSRFVPPTTQLSLPLTAALYTCLDVRPQRDPPFTKKPLQEPFRNDDDDEHHVVLHWRFSRSLAPLGGVGGPGNGWHSGIGMAWHGVVRRRTARVSTRWTTFSTALTRALQLESLHGGAKGSTVRICMDIYWK